MKSILTPLFGTEGDESSLAAASQIARTFNSNIVGYYAKPVPQIFVGDAMGIGGAYASDTTDIWIDLEKSARASFRAFMKQASIRIGKPGKNAQKPSASWHGPTGGRPSSVGEIGRLFDLIAISQPSEEGTDTVSICEEALFESGRPILLAPEPLSDKFGISIVIAWNGSTETARTIALGLPLLKQAKSVCVLTIEGGTVPGPTGEQVAEKLSLHGIKVASLSKSPRKRTIGEAILEEATSLEADLILKGAYTHSRLRQMVFGGATKHIMAAARIPIVMAH